MRSYSGPEVVGFRDDISGGDVLGLGVLDSRPGVPLRPSRPGSSPMAIRISRTARSMRGTSTRYSDGYGSFRGTKLVSNS